MEPDRRSCARAVASATFAAFAFVGSYTFKVSSYDSCGTLSTAIDISNSADGSSAFAIDCACVKIEQADSHRSYRGTDNWESHFACLVLKIVSLLILANHGQMSTFSCKGKYLGGRIYKVPFCSCRATEVEQMDGRSNQRSS